MKTCTLLSRLIAGAGLAFGSAAANGQLYRMLHEFGQTASNVQGQTGSDGYNPGGGVTVDGSGNLYGVTLGGGAFAYYGPNGQGGVLWSFSKSGVYTDLHDFGNGADGSHPVGNVAIDAAGTLYGVTQSGGSNPDSEGMLWELTASGSYYYLHDFGGNNDGCNPIGGVTIDGQGNLYGTTSIGGAYNAGTVWEYRANGSYLVLHSFGGTVTNADGTFGPDGITPTGTVAVDRSGDLFGTASAGGPNHGGIVWEIPNTPQSTYGDLYDFGGITPNGPDGSAPLGGVTFDGSWNLYGTASQGGAFDYGTVWTITSTGKFYTDLHDFGNTIVYADGSTGLDGVNPSGGVVVDKYYNVYGTAQNGSKYVGLGSGGGMAWGLTGLAGTYIDLYDFGSNLAVLPNNSYGRDGINPGAGSIALDASGNLYGTCSQGGPFGSNFQLGAGNVWTITGGLADCSVSPGSMYGGPNANGSVKLISGAPAGGLTVSLSSNSADTSFVHPVVTVLAGQDTATFTIYTEPVSISTSTAVTASVHDVNGRTIAKTANLELLGTSLGSIIVSEQVVLGWLSTNGWVHMSGPAPKGGFVVDLACTSASVIVPKSVTIPEGQSAVQFAIGTVPVAEKVTATISATFAKVTKKATITVKPPTPSSLALSSSTVYAGNAVLATVTLDGPAPGAGVKVALASNNEYAKVPSSVVVPAGKTTANFEVETLGTAATQTATITAKADSVSVTSTLKIDPAVLTALNLSYQSIIGGGSLTGTVLLSGEAPAGGMVIKLKSSSPDAVVPATVTIPAGKVSATFTIRTVKVTRQAVATITGTIGSYSYWRQLTINPNN